MDLKVILSLLYTGLSCADMGGRSGRILDQYPITGCQLADCTYVAVLAVLFWSLQPNGHNVSFCSVRFWQPDSDQCTWADQGLETWAGFFLWADLSQLRIELLWLQQTEQSSVTFCSWFVSQLSFRFNSPPHTYAFNESLLMIKAVSQNLSVCDVLRHLVTPDQVKHNDCQFKYVQSAEKQSAQCVFCINHTWPLQRNPAFLRLL